MKSNFLISVVVFFVSFFGQVLNAAAENVHIKVTDIRSKKGEVLVAVFKDQQGFKDNKPVKKQKYTKATIVNGSISFTLSLEPGTYGISILDDENSNLKMDYNMVGMPKEGFGFADYFHSSLSRPTFSDFKFELKGDKNVVAKLRYL
jgi:uncharacterized protein (DUF2141 family)